MATNNDTVTYTQFKVKCGQCGLHFIICTDYPESHSATTIYCPECGQHESKFVVWEDQIEGFIFQTVPGNAPLVSIGGQYVPSITNQTFDTLEEMSEAIEELRKQRKNDKNESD